MKVLAVLISTALVVAACSAGTRSDILIGDVAATEVADPTPTATPPVATPAPTPTSGAATDSAQDIASGFLDRQNDQAETDTATQTAQDIASGFLDRQNDQAETDTATQAAQDIASGFLDRQNEFPTETAEQISAEILADLQSQTLQDFTDQWAKLHGDGSAILPHLVVPALPEPTVTTTLDETIYGYDLDAAGILALSVADDSIIHGYSLVFNPTNAGATVLTALTLAIGEISLTMDFTDILLAPPVAETSVEGLTHSAAISSLEEGPNPVRIASILPPGSTRDVAAFGVNAITIASRFAVEVGRARFEERWPLAADYTVETTTLEALSPMSEASMDQVDGLTLATYEITDTVSVSVSIENAAINGYTLWFDHGSNDALGAVFTLGYVLGDAEVTNWVLDGLSGPFAEQARIDGAMHSAVLTRTGEDFISNPTWSLTVVPLDSTAEHEALAAASAAALRNGQ